MTSPPTTATTTAAAPTPQTDQTQTPNVQQRSQSLLPLLWQRLRESQTARFCRPSSINQAHSDTEIFQGLSVFIGLILLVQVLVSPSLALAVIATIYSNFWVPQIVRSARRGSTSGLRAEYLIGTTACRAFFALCKFQRCLGKWYSSISQICSLVLTMSLTSIHRVCLTSLH